MRKIKFKKEYLFAIAGIIAGLIFGIIFIPFFYSKPDTSIPIREHNGKYKFISPFLASYDAGSQSSQYNNLRNKLTNFINSNKSDGDRVSVYFRDLNKGQWMGIDENEGYYPASLLKVVIMISYLKQAESNPEILNQEFQYKSDLKDLMSTIEFEDPSKLVVGNSYSVDDLISRMIIDSDNGATGLLFAHLDNNFINQVYVDLNLPKPGTQGIYQISAQEYSLFLRVLYNATYINRELSEKALSILSKSKFKDGLRAGVPDNIVVSNKFGEYVIGSGSNVNDIELSDCGIIYAPDNPYFLCVMTHTPTLEKDKEIIKSISSIVYSEIEK